MKKLYDYIKPYIPMMSGGLVIKFLATMADLIIPFILAIIIDDCAKEGNKGKILFWGGVMVLCAAVSVTANIFANRIAALSAGKITKNLRHDLFAKITCLSANQADRFTIPSLISRLTSDTYYVNQMLARMQRIGVRGPILLIGGVIITLTLDPVLTLILMAMMPFIALITYLVTTKSLPVYISVQGALDKLTRTVLENFTGVRVVKALSKTGYEKNKFDRDNQNLNAKERRAGLMMSLTNPSATVILNLGLTFVVLAGAFRSNSGLTTPGVIIAFQTYFTIILNAMLGITNVFVMYTRGAASADRISQVLCAPGEMEVLPGEDRLQTETKPFRLEFQNVTFSYNKVEPNLKNISFALKPGGTLGIIGATGSGKTTIVNLINRFYDPDEGKIYIDGRDIRTIPKKELCEKLGNAFQSDFIEAATIAENIRFYRDLPDGALTEAAQTASAFHFINAYPEKFDYMLAPRGGNLSGGQKQRLLLARALAARPEILILDDASSALDYKTDSDFRKALHENYADTTKVIITQRISSIRHADMILVLDDGEIIGQGDHASLLNDCETYRAISETQMGAGL